MEIPAFINKCVDNGFKWVRENEAVLIKRGELKLKVEDKTILKHSWAKLFKRIGSFDVYHMSRVVGYYSRIQNWNPSKLGELSDRAKGKYGVV